MVSIWISDVMDTITATASMVTMASMGMARSTVTVTAMVTVRINKEYCGVLISVSNVKLEVFCHVFINR